MNRNIVVVGAGSHGQGVKEIILANRDNFLGFLDDNTEKPEVIGSVTRFDVPLVRDVEVVLAVNDPETRFKIDYRLGPGRSGKWADPIVHPSAVVGSNCILNEGVVVQAGVILTTNVYLGRHVHVNVGATISQGSSIRSHTSIAPGAHIAGEVTVGQKCMIGAGGIVINLIDICDETIVGAGAVVVKNITEPGTYVGVPAKKLEK